MIFPSLSSLPLFLNCIILENSMKILSMYIMFFKQIHLYLVPISPLVNTPTFHIAFLLLLSPLFPFFHVARCRAVTVHLWMSEDNLPELVLSFHCVGSRDWTQLLGFSFLQSHITHPNISLIKPNSAYDRIYIVFIFFLSLVYFIQYEDLQFYPLSWQW